MAGTNEVLIEVRPGRTRTALIEDGRLAELFVDDGNAPGLLGNIYLGRVEKVVHSLNAAFVDLGLERPGFLALAEVRPAGMRGKTGEGIWEHLCEGDRVVVQVIREPLEDKGPKLTARPALTARTVILTPDDPGVRISRRIDGKAARRRLQGLLQETAAPGEGFVVRTAAGDAAEADIAADVASLRRDANRLDEARQSGGSPRRLLDQADGVVRALRDHLPGNPCRIVIDDPQAYVRARTYLEAHAAGLLPRLSRHAESRPLLSEEGLADDLDRALSACIELPGGGTVIFSETPALTAIDVNTAGGGRGGREQAALSCNLEAAAEIARQIRLRNLGGLLVVDFVSMKSRDNGAKLLDALKRAVARDSVPVFVGGFTRFGLIEMTRKRARPSLAAALGTPCAPCSGGGWRLSPASIAYRTLDRLTVEAAADPSGAFILTCGEQTAAALAGPLKTALEAFEERHGRPVAVRADAARAEEDVEISKGNADG